MLAQGSSILVTDCCKFSIGKVAGCNASEPICSLVNLKIVDADPVDLRGRLQFPAKITEATGESIGVAGVACSGRQSIQCWRSNTVTAGKSQLVCIRQRNPTGLYWKSEGFIVPIEEQGQHNPFRGKGPYFVNAFELVEVLLARDCRDANNSRKKEQETNDEALL